MPNVLQMLFLNLLNFYKCKKEKKCISVVCSGIAIHQGASMHEFQRQKPFVETCTLPFHLGVKFRSEHCLVRHSVDLLGHVRGVVMYRSTDVYVFIM